MTAEPTCTTCVRPVSAPYRHRARGEVVAGCVSAAHDAHADSWHRRADAVRIRAAADGRIAVTR